MNDDTTSHETLTGTSFLDALSHAPFAIVITNPRHADNPIVYVNDTFTEMTGYARDFAVGQNCRFLQGDDRQQDGIVALRKAVAEGREITVDLNNYRPDGVMFRNQLTISPLYSQEGDLSFFLGIQMELEAKKDDPKTEADRRVRTALEEIQHRVKNHLSMVVGLIRMQSRQSGDSGAQDFNTLARRVEALQLLYAELADKSGAETENPEDELVALGAYLSRIANALGHLEGRSGIRVNVEAEKMSVPFQVATQVGLVLSELMTNALQHAFVDREEGLLEIEAKTLSNGVLRLVVSDDGHGIPDGVNWPQDGNLGSRIVRQLVRDLDASLDVASGGVQGTTLTLDVPEASLAQVEVEKA
ncbi:PAS domain-containing protein [uncultured Tateyamaria sp.]|uniref:sensor histidine kinase n=1 Tax=uncultured Tateyamaria sp. TaxID=455651 RepID=UPI002628288F|nr:PAS domain-containing protein [uncultured Tateyamaria sp.]